jgi:hypothetical protein
MKRRVTMVLALVATATGGCGSSASSGPSPPDAARLPLVRGSRIIEQVRECDRSANAFCGVELVVVNSRVHSSGALVTKERYRLGKLGWTFAQGDIPKEQAAQSPDGKLRATYATAANDLLGIDLGWIARSTTVARSLSRQMFAGVSAMSIMIETGPE